MKRLAVLFALAGLVGLVAAACAGEPEVVVEKEIVEIERVVEVPVETEKVVEHARAKLAKKGCDWILANDVSEASGTFGGDDNTVHLVRRDNGKDGPGDGGGEDDDAWPRMTKQEVADRLADRVAAHLAAQP